MNERAASTLTVRCHSSLRGLLCTAEHVLVLLEHVLDAVLACRSAECIDAIPALIIATSFVLLRC